MEYVQKNSNQLSDNEHAAIAHVAGRGFGQGDTPAMLKDTISHIYSSDFVATLYDSNQLIAFSMARRHLWR